MIVATIIIKGGFIIRTFEYNIEEKFNNLTVQEYLMKIHGFSKRIITRIKREPQHISCNGKHIKMVDYLKTHDILKITLSEKSTLIPNSNLLVDIVYEDDDIIVFNKPANMPVHPSLLHYDDTLGNFFAYYTNSKNQYLTFRPINRLDSNTQGLCIVAKNSLIAHLLSKNIKKEYTAVVCGNIKNDYGIINAPIAREKDTIIKRCVSSDGQESITEYSVEKRNNKYSLLRINLHTGRTHQIRVHFSYIGYPLAGDDLYGGDCSDIATQALCCNKLNFYHPILHKNMELCIDIPTNMKNLIN